MILRLALLTILSASLTLTARAQTTLSDLVQEAYADWMFGEWKATTDNGSTMRLNVSWDVNKQLVVLHVKADDMESKGYTILEPGAEQPTYLGIDTRGAVSKGVWNYEEGAMVLRLTTHRHYEAPSKWAAAFSGSAAQGLQIKMHSLNSTGSLVYPANMTLKFKK